MIQLKALDIGADMLCPPYQTEDRKQSQRTAKIFVTTIIEIK